MGRKKKGRIKKVDRTEDVCFLCKDGGSLRLCDFKNCMKAFHPYCVEQDDSLLENEEDWFCDWHFCNNCHKPAKFRCFCCPSAVCWRCLCDTEFEVVKGKKGFCGTCLELALLIEDKKNINFNGGPVDFNDRETHEYFFKCYWELVKEGEGLTSEKLHSSYNLLKEGKNCDFQANDNYEDDASDFEDESDQVSVSDCGDSNQVLYNNRRKKRRKFPLTKQKGKSNKMEFLGWASKQLAEFLTSAGKSVTQELSQHDVTTIVIEYCNEHKLFHLEKKKKVNCDERLRSLLGRKSVNRNSIYKLLTVHFAENWEPLEDSIQSSSKEEDDNILVPCKSQRKSIPDRKLEEKEIAQNPVQGYLAAIVSKNIRLVYLKGSLVEELAKQHIDTFYGKVVGSFVRVRSDPNDYMQKNSYMLVQVKGVKIKEEMSSIILLQVSNIINDVPLSKLSDDDLTEEECKDLYQRMKTGRLKRPTVVELEQKARTLHGDITRYWIRTELVLLQNKINWAYEKGWRRDEYMEKMLLLQKPDYQSRLIDEIPKVVADVLGPENATDYYLREDEEERKISSESSIFSRNQKNIESNKGFCCQTDGVDAAV